MNWTMTLTVAALGLAPMLTWALSVDRADVRRYALAALIAITFIGCAVIWPRKAEAQVFQCPSYCWEPACYYWICVPVPAIPMPEPLRVPKPEPWMWN